jgi:hypothetical protein
LEYLMTVVCAMAGALAAKALVKARAAVSLGREKRMLVSWVD